MTDTLRPSEILRIGIIDNHNALAAARADLELYRKLLASEALVAQLEATEAEYARDLEKVVAKEAADEKRKRKAAYRNLTITTANADRGVLAASYHISWETPTFDYMSGDSPWARRTADSFSTMDDRVYAYMMEFHPEAIPALIMALAPGNPEQAMERYFVGMKRGWVSGEAI